MQYEQDFTCNYFVSLLQQEGYRCCTVFVVSGNTDSTFFSRDIPTAAKCIILVAEDQNLNYDHDDCQYLTNMVRISFLSRNGCFLPYIFVLNNVHVPRYLRSYETFRLTLNHPSRMKKIRKYLKKVPTKEFSFLYQDASTYDYDAYMAMSESGCTECVQFLQTLMNYFDSDVTYNFFIEYKDIVPGRIMTDEIEEQMHNSSSLIIIYDECFFEDELAAFKIELGKQLHHSNNKFKLVVMERIPIAAEHVCYFKLFSRITIKKTDEKRAFYHISKILFKTATARMFNQQPPEKLVSKDRQGIELFQRVVNTESEELYYIKLIVLGQEGVGKTSLVRRLLQQSVYPVESTNGIEINVNTCSISLHDGKWKNQQDMYSTNGDVILMRKFSEMPQYTKLKNEIAKKKLEKPTKVVLAFRNVDKTLRSLIESEKKLSIIEAWQDSLDNLSLEESFDSGKNAIVSIWDFAGQKEYYPTHQLFLSKNCIVLLVSNIDKGLEGLKENANKENSAFEDVLNGSKLNSSESTTMENQEEIMSDMKDYIQYWTKSIHCYGYTSTDHDNLLNPPIIPVVTHTDLLENNVQQYVDDYQQALLNSLGTDRRKDHFRNFFALSNTHSSDAEIENLRQYIFTIAKQQENWGDKVPVKWIPFANKIQELRQEGKTVASFDDIRKINSSLLSPLPNSQDIISFLVLHHEIGNIIYFEDIGESVILCPQWFANALRCVVAAKRFKASFLHMDWEQYEQTGFLQKNLIELLFKETDSSLSEFKEHIFNVMEKYDILVLADTPKHEHNNDFSYLVPCMVRTSGWTIISSKFKDYTKSAILCFEYDFLPPMFFYHVVVYFLRRFKLASDDRNPSNYIGELYRNLAVFDIDETGCEKILLCSHKNNIQVQVWTWGTGDENTGRMIRGLLEDDMFVIQRKYDVMKTVEVKIKCPEGTLTSNKGGINLENLKTAREYVCKEHNTIHECIPFKFYWMLQVVQGDGVSGEEHNFIRISKASVEVLTDILYDLARSSACTNIKQRNESDITYLYAELRRQDCAQNRPSRGQWGGQNWPCESAAVNVGDDIERIRLNRNRLQHTSHFEMSNFEYNDRWQKLNALAKRFDVRLKPSTFYEEKLLRLQHYLGGKRDFQNIQNKEAKVKVLKPTRRCNLDTVKS